MGHKKRIVYGGKIFTVRLSQEVSAKINALANKHYEGKHSALLRKIIQLGLEALSKEK